MIVDIPWDYTSIEDLAHWLRKNFPDTGQGTRWAINTHPKWNLWFKDPADATLFILTWK